MATLREDEELHGKQNRRLGEPSANTTPLKRTNGDRNKISRATLRTNWESPRIAWSVCVESSSGLRMYVMKITKSITILHARYGVTEVQIMTT